MNGLLVSTFNEALEAGVDVHPNFLTFTHVSELKYQYDSIATTLVISINKKTVEETCIVMPS
jgi:hypothetical protein